MFTLYIFNNNKYIYITYKLVRLIKLPISFGIAVILFFSNCLIVINYYFILIKINTF